MRLKHTTNDVMWPIHAEATPVILTTEEEFALWLTAPAKEALAPQRQLPNEMLRIVAKGEKRPSGPWLFRWAMVGGSGGKAVAVGTLSRGVQSAKQV